MKKIVALLLAMLMVLANVAALAEDPAVPSLRNVVTENDPAPAEGTPKYYFEKSYSIEGNTVFPTETLSFSVAAASGWTNPDSNTNVEVSDYTITKKENNKIPVTIYDPDDSHFTEVGIYKYTITESTGTTHGVTYNADPVNVVVYVKYNDAKTAKVIDTVQIFSAINEETKTKLDGVTNDYEVGTLTVSKTVSGALGDTTMDFVVTVDLDAGTKYVHNDITTEITDTTKARVKENQADSGATAGWTGKKTITMTVKDGGSVTIKDIPSGVSYTVKEIKAVVDGIEKELTYLSDKTDSPNSQSAYKVSYGDTVAESISSSATGTIGSDEEQGQSLAASVSIKNEKDMPKPETGITLETLPYVLIMAIAVMGVVMLTLRKREEY